MPQPDPFPERSDLRAHLQSPPLFTIQVDGAPLTIVSAWGLFSAKQIDEGTALLLQELRALPPQGHVLDLGCGYGALGLVLAKAWPQSRVVLADKDLLAVEAAQANIDRNGLTNARALLSPGFRDVPAGPYDLIVANLPAQAGNEAIDELLLGAYDHLAPGGTIVVVTVLGLRRFLKRRLLAIFGNYHKAKQGARHAVAEATRDLQP